MSRKYITRPIGRVFEYYDGVKKCKVVTLVPVYSEDDFCAGCYFCNSQGRCMRVTAESGYCSTKWRSDGISAKFVEVVS